MTPFSLGKVVVATAGTPVQLGTTTLNGAIAAGAVALTVNSNNGIPLAKSFAFFVQIDAEIFLVTANATTGWTVVGGQKQTTPAAHANGAAVTVLLQFSFLNASVIAGLTGKCYLGCKGITVSTFAGVIKEFWPNNAGGVDDSFQLPMQMRETYNLTDFWIDVGVSAEGLIISGLVPTIQ